MSQVFTTTEVGEICRVSARTVAKWIDKGFLAGYYLPGSRDRRVTRRELVLFMERHSIPMDLLPTEVLEEEPEGV